MATINLKDFSGGMNQHSSPDLIQLNQSGLVLNCNLDQDGNVAVRTGTDMIVNIPGVGEIRGMGIQDRITGNPRFFWTADGALYYYNGTTWTNEIYTSVGTATISNGADATVTKNGHGLATGDAVFLTTDGGLPTGLTASVISTNTFTKYFAIYHDANVIHLATSYANAIAGNSITTSSAGSGTHTLYKYTDAISAGYDIDFVSFNGKLYYLGIGVTSTSVPSDITWTRSGTDNFNVTSR